MNVKPRSFTLSNFAMGTILGMGFPQAQVHTVHSTSACGKSIPKIAPMAKLHSLLEFALIFISGIFQIGEEKKIAHQIAGCNNLLCVNDAL